jgi:hypothetical protein
MKIVMMVIMLMEMAVQIYAKLSLFYLCSAPSVCTWSCGDSIYQPETGEQCDISLFNPEEKL